MQWVKPVEEKKRDLVEELLLPGVNRSAVCARWGVSRKHAYTLLRQYEAEGLEGLKPRSRRPGSSPGQTSAEVEAVVLALRDEDPAWGPRKIARRMRDRGAQQIPAPSTITAILRRHGRITEEASEQREHYVRFERERPNELWQMDFKGHFGMRDGARCHPLMVLDDHSRYCVCARACLNETAQTVEGELKQTFRAYGLPEQMLMDNGAPWGYDARHVYTRLVVWLLRLGIRVSHGRPLHPQTQGKLERLNQTLKDEALREEFQDQGHAQRRFDTWRPRYNEVRPHEALDMEVPASRYRPSNRAYPARLPAIEYEESDDVRKVQDKGRLSYRGKAYRVARCFRGFPVAIRRLESEMEKAEVYFCRQRIATLDLERGTSEPARG